MVISLFPYFSTLLVLLIELLWNCLLPFGIIEYRIFSFSLFDSYFYQPFHIPTVPFSPSVTTSLWTLKTLKKTTKRWAMPAGHGFGGGCMAGLYALGKGNGFGWGRNCRLPRWTASCSLNRVHSFLPFARDSEDHNAKQTSEPVHARH